MKCKLCLQEKDLLKKSHIISNFMYKDLYDEKHTLVKVNLATNKESIVQSGEYEKDILCKHCDNVVLGQLEGYGKNVLHGGNIKGISTVNEKNQNGVSWIRCNGIDYKKFKLFLLSILWRCSISSNDYYNSVKLGPFEEIIREMIIKNDAKRQMDFPCIISTYRQNKNLPHQIISQPRKSRNNAGKTMYSIIIEGFLYTFIVTLDNKDDFVKEIVINEEGEIKILHIEDEVAGKLLIRSFGEMNRNLFENNK
jgi:hypothetical protein